MSPFAHLPLELVHSIFNFAAAASRVTALSLCRVVSWARHIALPHLHHTVVIKDRSASAQFHQYARTPPYKPANPDFRPFPLIRNVWMEISSDRIISIFNASDNIKHLALSCDAFQWLIHSSSPGTSDDRFCTRISERALAREQDLHLTMISAGENWSHSAYASDDVTRRSPLFSKITHIRLAKIVSNQTPGHLRHFTRLSHLAVPTCGWPLHTFASYLRDLLELPTLEMLVVIVTGSFSDGDRTLVEELVAGMRNEDSRIYLAEGFYHEVTIQEQWEVEMRGGECIWDKAVLYTREYGTKG